MKRSIIYTAIAVTLGAVSGSVFAEQTRVTVTIENLAPTQGTNQTPHWVGFHNGDFDLYNTGSAADFLPVENDPRRSIERLAEDGNTGPLSETFGEFVGNGVGSVDGTIAGPNGPIAPGDIAEMSFELDSNSASSRFFSYASMVLPSNDFWYANANPVAHQIFDENGNFIGKDFIVNNLSVRDAGTEVNDEGPESTAFFGQSVPNTGTEEFNVITAFDGESGAVRFTAGGRILSEERFSMANFALEGYPLVKISFTAEAIQDDPVIQPKERFKAFAAHAQLSGEQQVPAAVSTNASGNTTAVVSNNRVKVLSRFRHLTDIRMAHLHLGVAGENGPVIANLIESKFDLDKAGVQRRLTRALLSRIKSEDLLGPLAGQPINILADAIKEGRVYVNIHTSANPNGEIRGQLNAK